MGLPTFSAPDLKRLQDLGLLREQIAELVKALPICRSYLRQPAALADVRAVLGDTRTAVENAIRQLDRFDRVESSAYGEARVRFDQAYFANARVPETRDEELLNAALNYLDRVRTSLTDALADLPTEQRRHRTASFVPVMKIDGALLRGFTLAHKPPMPPYLLHASISPGSTFREVVGLCYRAIGANDDPERAIKGYIRWRKERDRASRIAFGIPVEADSSRPARRKVGQQIKKK